MNQRPQDFRRITKINQKEKVGIFSSGLLLFIIPGMLIFFGIIYLFDNAFIGLLIGIFIVLVLLVSGGIEPYKFIRSVINSTSKRKWFWGRRPSQSIFREK